MKTRKPAVAFQFYPGEPRELRQLVAGYIDDSGVEPSPESTVAVVAPHAGYIYSGPTAGFAYARIKGKKPDRVLLLGCSHRFHIPTASVFTEGAFETPLGTFPVDEAFAAAFAKEAKAASIEPHIHEHSLEVQLPFLWMALGEVPIVPILFGGSATDWHVQMGRRLAEMAGENDLAVASTDLSHYLTEESANQIDKHTLDTVLAKNPAAVVKGLEDDSCSMCGGAAVVAALSFALARNANKWQLLDYRTSAATSGDYGHVVGYGAISMETAA